ncbi:eukaryotic translation initiation factor-like protein subunit eIF2B-gamma [Patellaria atrata CBS 101060]|uniref:Translation initiation factor eIF2B subunit gamma n=1 Tax=Patellaria atrata CBS 101060 TaxID=1346257 RepID=A0A9P4SLG3_9PEZI|nr:eukaryotic translation initiation factor-like protein subunit eIF2B-gamma [Patellaria atrata CBS 101060]
MPHATGPSAGFQAIILCGPGVSLTTFTSNPKDFPKALIPIANRPMVWYPLEWCYRMGVTDITLITPPESEAALEAALSQNPHLTSLPTPKPDILAPKDLTQTTSTGEIFRFPEVREAITGDFIVLPCDLVCELNGALLAETWLINQAAFGGSAAHINDTRILQTSNGGEKNGRRGGLGVWFQTKCETSVKGEETDFIITAPLQKPVVPPPVGSLIPEISNLVYSVPTDTLKDIIEAEKSFPIRHALLRKHAKIKMYTTYRDSHLYFFPHWVLDMIAKNEKFDSVSEDVLGWWAKAGWQDGLADKLGLNEILDNTGDDGGEDAMVSSGILEDTVDVASLSTTQASTEPSRTFASRVSSIASDLSVPSILAYVQPSSPTLPLIRRVDTVPLLLSVSLRLAKLSSIADAGKEASPFAHTTKIAHPEAVPRRCRVETQDSLLAENVTVEEKVNIKESVIGANCKIGEGARLLRCLLMEGAVVGENVQLTGCVLGRRCHIVGGPAKGDEKTNLKDCEVQEGFHVEWGSKCRPTSFF